MALLRLAGARKLTSKGVAGQSARLVLLFALAAGIAAAACGTDSRSTFPMGPPDGGGSDATTMDPDGGMTFFPDGSTGGGDSASGPITISPPNPSVDVPFGQTSPTVTFTAMTTGGQKVPASFSIDRGEIGTLQASNGVFTPAGQLGGTATVTAKYNGSTASTHVTVVLHRVENGGPAVADAGAGEAGTGDAGGGAGGAGGVGGEGPGGPVTAGQQQVLQGAPTADPAMSWLYPYDMTVWPRGILAPLLQWSAPGHNFDAVLIHIHENAFDYQGTFAKTATPFIHHPITQATWQAVAYSNAGEPVTVSLIFAEGNKAYGPLTETWTIAGGELKGTVYYNSYGTNLAHNYTYGQVTFGGATLAIKGGSTDPVLVAGNDTECRVCHSVAANGSRLITQQGSSYGASSAYDLMNGYTQTNMTPTDGRFEWPAISPDGTFLFSNSSAALGGATMPSALYQVPSGTPVASTGLPAGLGAACPAFSPDGKHLAFNFYGGAGADQKSLASMDYAQATSTFSNMTTLYTPSQGTVVWPSYLPTNDGLVFQLETVYNGRDFAGTRSTCDSSAACSNTGTQAELWWLDVKTKMAQRLANLNGVGYVPKGTDHMQDELLNYEPTVNPVPSGGYSWVVFTSRRMYGNVATINPYWSDPRFHDIRQTPTTKKLWVAAVDLNAKPGTDPSHPAFYLPAQELLAGNSRGFWVVDPCKTGGLSCATGDECCGGFCRPGGDGGALVCTDQTPTCAQEFEKCASDADCCGVGQGISCINGRCARQSPQ